VPQIHGMPTSGNDQLISLHSPEVATCQWRSTSRRHNA